MGLENLQHLLEHVRPTVLFQIGDIPITTTVFNTWIVMLILLPVVYFLSRRLQTIPRGMQNLLELLADFINGLLEDTMGKEGRKFLPW